MTNEERMLTGIVLDEEHEITVEEVTQFCAVRHEKIMQLVMEGIIEPRDARSGEWRFSGRALVRAKKAIRLESDLDVNLSAVAIILDLLDEIDALRATLGRSGK